MVVTVAMAIVRWLGGGEMKSQWDGGAADEFLTRLEAISTSERMN